MATKLPPLDARILKWDHDDLKERNCPFCNSVNTNNSYIRPDNLTVRLCNQCTTFYVSPAPSERQLNFFYSTYDEKHRREPKVPPLELFKSYKSMEPFSDLRIRELSSILNFKNSKVLDVGFGRAQFLYLLYKLDVIPYGVEVDEKAIEFAQAIGIKNIFKGTLSDISDEKKFNLVILNDLIEHPLDPMNLLKKASDHLEKNGFLLIWTPNGDFTNYEDYPTTFRVDLEHMQYLTQDTCIFVASKLNLRIVHMETVGFPSLAGIDKPITEGSVMKSKTKKIKNIFKAMPGFSILNDFRKRIFVKPKEIKDERTGNYHLFCIMQKSTE